MMDLSSVVDAGLVVMGAMAVLLMGLWTLSAESSTVSISAPPVETVRQQVDMASLWLHCPKQRKPHRMQRGKTVEGLSSRALIQGDQHVGRDVALGQSALGRRPASYGIVCLEVVPLKPQDVSDQHFPVLCGHPDKASVEAISPSRIGDGIEPQHFGQGCEEAMVGKPQRDREDVVGLIDRGDCHAEAAAADVDGLFDERTLRHVGLGLNADGQSDGDPIIFATIFPGRLRSQFI